MLCSLYTQKVQYKCSCLGKLYILSRQGNLQLVTSFSPANILLPVQTEWNGKNAWILHLHSNSQLNMGGRCCSAGEGEHAFIFLLKLSGFLISETTSSSLLNPGSMERISNPKKVKATSESSNSLAEEFQVTIELCFVREICKNDFFKKWVQSCYKYVGSVENELQ